MEKISWTDRVKNEVLQRVNKEWNIVQTKRKGRLTGLVTSCIDLPSKTRYWREGRGKGGSDGKRRKKT